MFALSSTEVNESYQRGRLEVDGAHFLPGHLSEGERVSSSFPARRPAWVAWSLNKHLRKDCVSAPSTLLDRHIVRFRFTHLVPSLFHPRRRVCGPLKVKAIDAVVEPCIYRSGHAWAVIILDAIVCPKFAVMLRILRRAQLLGILYVLPVAQSFVKMPRKVELFLGLPWPPWVKGKHATSIRRVSRMHSLILHTMRK